MTSKRNVAATFSAAWVVYQVFISPWMRSRSAATMKETLLRPEMGLHNVIEAA